MNLDAFTLAYIKCALWSSEDEDGQPLDEKYQIKHISAETLAEMIADCRDFQREHLGEVAANFSQAGHDFWLTRNRHGSGFWDGGWPEDIGRELSNAAKGFRKFSLCIGSDGRIHHETVSA